VINAVAYFLSGQSHSAGVESLKDMINAGIVFRWVFLTENNGVYGGVVKLLSVQNG
jgi:hypothetical protein